MNPAALPVATTGRRTAWACLASTLVAGLVVLLEALLTDYEGPDSPPAWWLSYALFLGVLLVATGLISRPRRLSPTVVLAALVVVGMATFLLYADQGWTAVIVVVSAAVVARYASPRALVAVIVLQTTAVAVGTAAAGWPGSDVVMGAIAYAGFQAFGALVVLAARRETEARQELVATHAELRSTVALLEATSRDAERLRIARELHDVVGHQLTALALELEVASHSPAPDEHVARSRAIAKGLLADVRAAVGEMRAESQPLEHCLTALARDIPGLTVSVTVGDGVRVDARQTSVLLRCAQEAITNTLRHADAARLDLVVEADPSGVLLSATDDGRGTERVEPGHGLLGMRERLESLGGSLSVQASPGSGFRLVGRLPGTSPAEVTT